MQRQLNTCLKQATIFAIGLSAAINAQAGSSFASIADASVTATTDTTLNFRVTHGGDTGYAVVVPYFSTDDSATSPTDYNAVAGLLTIPAGTRTGQIAVPVRAHTGAAQSFFMNLAGATGVGASSTFADHADFTTGTSPTSVTSADVNGDGLLDLIDADSNTGVISVHLNTTAPGASTPSFAAPQSFAGGFSAYFVRSADLNNDGRPDLLIGYSNADSMAVMLNTTAPGAATASFTAVQTLATGYRPRTVAAVDLNGDGKLDLVAGNYADNTLSVMLNTTAPGDATASFSAQVTFATTGSPNSVAAADVNGDGRPDVLVANLQGQTVSVFLNTTALGAATPNLAAPQNFGTDPVGFANSVAAADLNGDGRLDLVVGNQGSNSTSVLLNTTKAGASTMSFAAQKLADSGDGTYASVADVNGDGKPDLMFSTTNGGFGAVVVAFNITPPGASAPAFVAPRSSFFLTGDGPNSIFAADFNGDGKPDLVTANATASSLSVLLNTTPSTTAALGFAKQQTVKTGQFPRSIASADINKDGRPDLLIVNQDDNTVSVLLDTAAAGSLVPRFAIQKTFATGLTPRSVSTADINGDGRPDLLVANYNGASVSVLLNTTKPGAIAPKFAVQKSFDLGAPVYPGAAVSTADINRDGRPDLLVANDKAGTVSVLLNTTRPGALTPAFAAKQSFSVGSPSGTAGASSVSAADVNGDGKPDLLVTNQADNSVSVLINTTLAGGFVPRFAVQHSFATDFQPYSVSAADVNGDGKPDLVVANFGSSVSVLLNTTATGAGVPQFAAQQSFPTGSAPASVTTADVNGDGRPDLLLANSGLSKSASVLLNTTAPGAASPSFDAEQEFATGQSAGAIVAADFNGDGQPDLAVTNGSDDTVSVLLSTLFSASLRDSFAVGTIK